MKILYVVPYAPSRIRTRPYNLIRQLSSRGHQVSLLTVWTGDVERSDVDALRDTCYRVIALPLRRPRSAWNCLLALPTHEPLQSVYCWHPALAAKMWGLVREGGMRSAFDLVHIEHLRGAKYGRMLRARLRQAGSSLPLVWDSVDCISLLFRHTARQSAGRASRAIARLECGRTEAYERRAVQEFDKVLVTSPADRAALLSLSGETVGDDRVCVLPNGVDLEYFQIGGRDTRARDTLVMTGKMSYHANVKMVLHFVTAIWPVIRSGMPDVRLWIVGKDPPRELRRLGEDPTIRVTGTVPDLRPYLQAATVAVAPLAYGVGIQNKILEAMACATPVVTTSQALSALSAVPYRDLVVGDEPAAFAAAVIELLRKPDWRAEVGLSGRRYVEAKHAWPTIAARLEEVYDAAIRAG
jgi:sugar transferase (PEP-CTERM/EpsH1 system associated)